MMNGIANAASHIPTWIYALIATGLFLWWWNGPILAAIGAITILVLARKFNW